MEGEVDSASNVEPLQCLGDLWADARQRFYLGKQRIEDVRPHDEGLAGHSPLAIWLPSPYMAAMPPMDDELKALQWRAWHRGTREADLMIGGFFDAHRRQWGPPERDWFSG